MNLRHTPYRILVGFAFALTIALACADKSEAMRVREVFPRVRGSLAQALAEAKPGDTVLLRAGVFKERGLVIDKPLTVLAANEAKGGAKDEAGRAIIDAEFKGTSILFLRANGVKIRGVSFRNVPISYMNDNAAIRGEGVRDCAIENARFDDAFFGVYFATSANCVVRGNVFIARKGDESSSGNGVHLWRCDNMTVENNRIQGHRDGVYLEFNRRALVRSNWSEGNMRYGLHFMFSDSCRYEENTFIRNGSGVAVMYSRCVEMTNNVFEDNWGAASYGVLLKDIADSRIERNVFARNTTGVYADGVSRVMIRLNEFRENGWALKVFGSSSDNEVRRNNFIGNSFDVSTNSFDNNNRFEGNYWSRYAGYDLNRDGVGDAPFRPVRLFSVLVEQQQPALALMHSLFVNMLDLAERVVPALTPEALVDEKPAMKPHSLERAPISFTQQKKP